MSKQIFWISSFPKSGNTLLRSILVSLFFSNNGNFSLDKLKNINQFEKTAHVYKNKNIFGDDYKNINNISVFYKYLVKLQSRKLLKLDHDFIFFKSHSGLFEIGGNPFTIQDNCRGIIYMVRDPRDICISWSKHLGISIDKTIENMTNFVASSQWEEPKQKRYFEEKNRPKYLLSSWDKHVLSWTSLKWNLPIMIIKYEDLVYKKKEKILELISFFNENYNFKFDNIEIKLQNILATTEFEKLKKEELETGFIESANNNFFSVGKKNQWKEILNQEQVEKIENKFSMVMKKFDYKLAIEF